MASSSSSSSSSSGAGEMPAIVAEAVLAESETLPEDTPEVRGVDFDQEGGPGLDEVMQAMLHTGFQASNVGLAVEEINKMITWRLSDEPVDEDEDEEYKDPEVRRRTKCKIFLAYTSNMISCGVRETIKFLVKHKMVDVLVTTAGGIEEDFIKCMAPTYMGDFALAGRDLRKRGINRIGNLLVPNRNYCLFEDFLRPLLHTMTDEQVNDGVRWTPSKLINRLGKEINHEDSVYYWAWKNDIPVYCPAVTDGSVGDMIYFHMYKRPEFVLDIAEDIRGMNNEAVFAKATGMIILGGGLAKHHTCNANLMRNGANFSVFINTGQEFDGSDSGAKPDEAISWGKIRLDATPVKVTADASIVFPLIVSQTFAKNGTRLEHTSGPAATAPAATTAAAQATEEEGDSSTL